MTQTNPLVRAGWYTTLGINFSGTIAGGAVVGWMIDRWLGSAPCALLTCTVLGRGGPRLAIALLVAKLLAFLGFGWLAFASGREHRPDPIGFAVGLTCFPVAAVWEAMRVRGS